MKVIIAGSRSITDSDSVAIAVILSQFSPITEVVCGMADGVDLLGKRRAEEKGIPVAEFPADWKRHGRRAGILRNQQMAEYADALIAVWDGESRGTAHMIKAAQWEGLKVYVFQKGGVGGWK